MKIKFQADADLIEHVVHGVRQSAPEIDILTANESSLEGVDDPIVLQIAASDGRILLTHDRRTMPHHFADFIAEFTCPGVIIVPKRVELVRVIDALIFIWAASDASEYQDRIVDLRSLMS